MHAAGFPLNRPLNRGAAVLVFCAGLGFHPVLASTVVVPDDVSTVQSAIDSGADTVLIREGTYPERPTVDRAVVLQGIAIDQPPQLEGLAVTNLNFPLSLPGVLTVSRIHFTGRVEHTTVAVHPRNLIFGFTDCGLDSGFVQLVSLDPDDVASLTIRDCYLGARSQARAYQVLMEADTVDAGVSWDTHGVSILNCWFRGGSGVAIELTDTPRGTAARNRIENYDTGIVGVNMDPYTIEDNTITHCGMGVQLGGGHNVNITDNAILDCGVAVDAIGSEDVSLLNNAILGAKGPSVTMSSVSLLAEHNVVGKCGGSGFVLRAPQPTVQWDATVVRGNTFFANDGDGIEVTGTLGYPMWVEGNIVFGNLGWGLSVPPGQPVQLGCNDWFGNALGAVNGPAVGSTDLSVDPLFCNVDSADVTLRSASPLLGDSACGQIGALGGGCGMTATLVQRFTAERVSDGIRVVWEVAEGATASEVWLERSEGMDGEPWIRPLTERSIENRAVVELDESALSDRTYWYRLVAREGSDDTVIGPAIMVEGEARLEFRLVQVGPNPGSGPVRIAFALEHAAAIEIDVFDVQGRRVASPGRGVWPAGTHVVEWNGLARNGEAAPSGLYLVRYVYPGGQDRRRLVRAL